MHIGNRPGNNSCTQSDSHRTSSSCFCLSGVNTSTMRRIVSGQPTSQTASFGSQMRWSSPRSTIMFLMPGLTCAHFPLILFACSVRASHSMSSLGHYRQCCSLRIRGVLISGDQCLFPKGNLYPIHCRYIHEGTNTVCTMVHAEAIHRKCGDVPDGFDV